MKGLFGLSEDEIDKLTDEFFTPETMTEINRVVENFHRKANSFCIGKGFPPGEPTDQYCKMMTFLMTQVMSQLLLIFFSNLRMAPQNHVQEHFQIMIGAFEAGAKSWIGIDPEFKERKTIQ